MYIMCVKVIAVPSQDSERSCILCVFKVIAVPSQDSGRLCILCVLRLSLYQARTVRGHVYYVCEGYRCTKPGQ